MEMEAISLVILSGGRSLRMGSPKAYLKIEGHTFAGHLANRLSPADEVLFSVGKPEDYPDIPIRHIPDYYPGCGPLAGIHSALKHSRNPLVFVTACDMPFLSWKTVEEMYSYYKQGADAVVAVTSEGTMHAVCGLYHRQLLPLLEKHLESGDYRMRSLLDSCNCIKVAEESFSDYKRVFRNVNTPEDYREVIQ